MKKTTTTGKPATTRHQAPLGGCGNCSPFHMCDACTDADLDNEIAERAIHIPMTLQHDGSTLTTDHVLITQSGHRHGVGAVPRGKEGRRVHGGPMEPGPWAFAFGLCVVLNNHGGSAAESSRLDADGKQHRVTTGDTLQIDGVIYFVTVERGQFVTLSETS